MFYKLLVGILILDAMVLAAAVLLQAGKGGGLAASFGGAGSSPNSLLGSREAGNLLTKASWWSGGIFMGLAFVLSLMASAGRTQARSVLDPLATPSAAAPAPVPSTGTSQSAPLAPIVPPPADQKQDSKQPPAKKAAEKAPTGKQQ